jgi:hypothetical protein
VKDPVAETLPDASSARTHARRDFLKKAAVAGVTVAYAAPIIETLQASSVAASAVSTGGICAPFGSGCYGCALTHGFGNGQFKTTGGAGSAACIVQAALVNAQAYFDPGKTFVFADSKDGTVKLSCIYNDACTTATAPCGPGTSDQNDMATLLNTDLTSTWNNSCGAKDLLALMLLVGLNRTGGCYSVGPACCTSTGGQSCAGLGLNTCVNASAYDSADFAGTASVGVVIQTAINQTIQGTLCSNTGLINLLQAMAQDVCIGSGVYPGGTCASS